MINSTTNEIVDRTKQFNNSEEHYDQLYTFDSWYRDCFTRAIAHIQANERLFRLNQMLVLTSVLLTVTASSSIITGILFNTGAPSTNQILYYVAFGLCIIVSLLITVQSILKLPVRAQLHHQAFVDYQDLRNDIEHQLHEYFTRHRDMEILNENMVKIIDSLKIIESVAPYISQKDYQKAVEKVLGYFQLIEELVKTRKESEITKDELNKANINLDEIQSTIIEKEEQDIQVEDQLIQTREEYQKEIAHLNSILVQRDRKLEEQSKQIEEQNKQLQSVIGTKDLLSYQTQIKRIIMTMQAIDEITLQKKTRVLILAADPIYQPRLDDCEEVKLINDQLMRRDYLFKPIIEVAFRKKELVRFIKDYTPNVIHFIGHGDFDGELKIKGDDDDEYISPKTLEQILNLIKKELKCVFLNACYTEETAEQIKNSADCIIGMRGRIDDDVAKYFAEGFYIGAVKGDNVVDAIKAGKAQAEVMLANENPNIDQELEKIKILEGRKHPAKVDLLPYAVKTN